MCDGCRHFSHPNHSFGYIADLAADERVRLTAVGTQCGTLAQLLRSRLDELHKASMTCVQSADTAKMKMMQWMDDLRAAIDARQQQLAQQIESIAKVRFSVKNTSIISVVGGRRLSLIMGFKQSVFMSAPPLIALLLVSYLRYFSL